MARILNGTLANIVAELTAKILIFLADRRHQQAKVRHLGAVEGKDHSEKTIRIMTTRFFSILS